MVFILRFLASNLVSEPGSNSVGTMGTASSCGKDNDDLINIFKVHNYITSKKVERVFRAVDRGDYISESYRELAYQDMSCKVGNIHLSAPCIYCRVMEGLSLQPGQSFLNIGSGTGYLSTMVGLILGDSGTNHGIEMHEDCLIYAQEHLEKFKRQSLDVDVFEFCEPVFQLGNFINVVPNRQYDRVYCGAACPEAYEKFVKQFVKIGGILVMPYKDHLRRIERTGEKTWFNHTMLPVSFAPLMPPQEENERCRLIQLPLWKPRSLQELCRSAIRNHLRRMVWAENDDLETKRPIKFRPMGRSRSDDRSLPLAERNRTRSREVVRTATTVQLVMNTTMQSILTDGPGEFYRNDSLPDSNDDSEEDSEPNQRNRLDHAVSMNEEETEDCGNTKESRENGATERGTGEDEEEERDSARRADGGQSSSSKAKSAVSNESSSDEERGTVESMSDDEEENTVGETDRNYVLVRNFFSRIASIMEIQDSPGTSDSSSPDWSSSSSSDDDASRQISGTLPNENSGKRQRDDGATSNGGEAEQGQSSPRSSNSRGERCRSEERGTKIRVLSTAEHETADRATRKTSKIEDKKDRKIDTDTSNTSSEEGDKEEETTDERTNYRRDYRAGQKRRSERKSSGGNKDESRVKKTHKSEVNSSSEKSASSFVTMSTDSSFDTARSDSDCELRSAARKPKVAQISAHTIRKDLFSAYMKKKILLLPLPPPLRVYVNYDREL